MEANGAYANAGNAYDRNGIELQTFPRPFSGRVVLNGMYESSTHCPDQYIEMNPAAVNYDDSAGIYLKWLVV